MLRTSQILCCWSTLPHVVTHLSTSITTVKEWKSARLNPVGRFLIGVELLTIKLQSAKKTAYGRFLCIISQCFDKRISPCQIPLGRKAPSIIHFPLLFWSFQHHDAICDAHIHGVIRTPAENFPNNSASKNNSALFCSRLILQPMLYCCNILLKLLICCKDFVGNFSNGKLDLCYKY